MGKKKYVPTSDQQLEERVTFVKSLVANFASRGTIMSKTKERFGVQTNTVDKYIRLAKAELKKEVDKEEFAGILLQNFQSLYQRNLKEQDYKEAHALLKSMGALLGLGKTGGLDGPVEIDTSKKVKITFFD